MQGTFSKIFEDEKETSVYILVDNSCSTFSGTMEDKRELIIQICADLTDSSIRYNNDKTGLIIFSDKILLHIPPYKSLDHTRYIINKLLSFKSEIEKTNLSKALIKTNNIIKNESLIIIISDFFDSEFDKEISILSKKHEVVGIQILDKLDWYLPEIGLMEIKDIETGVKMLVDTNNKNIQKMYTEQFEIKTKNIQNTFSMANARLIQLLTGEDHVKKLRKFFMR